MCLAVEVAVDTPGGLMVPNIKDKKDKRNAIRGQVISLAER